jgi:hypothetical protein
MNNWCCENKGNPSVPLMASKVCKSSIENKGILHYNRMYGAYGSSAGNSPMTYLHHIIMIGRLLCKGLNHLLSRPF